MQEHKRTISKKLQLEETITSDIPESKATKRAKEYTNSDEPIDFVARLRTETLFRNGYVEISNNLYSTRQVKGKTIANRIPAIEAKIDVLSKRLVFTVPEHLDHSPKEHGVVFETRFTSPTGDSQELEIYRSDMLARQPRFWEQVHSVAIPHTKYKNDVIHAIEILGTLAPIENRYNATGLIRLENNLAFLNPVSGAITSEGIDDRYLVQFGLKHQAVLNRCGYGWQAISSHPIDDFHTTLGIRKVAPGSQGYGDVVLGTPLFAPFSQLCSTGGVHGIIHGLSGVMKSATARLGLQLYSHVWGRDEISTVNFAGMRTTLPSILQIEYYLAGMFIYGDDALKGKDIGEKDIKKFYDFMSTRGRLAATREGYDRSMWDKGDMGLATAHYPRGSSLITVEILPNSEDHTSELARYVLVSLDVDSVDIDVLTKLQSEESSGAMNRSMASFIQWLLPRISGLLATLESREDYYRAYNFHSRMPTTYAKLELAHSAYLQYGVSIGALTENEAETLLCEIKENLLSVALRQKALIGIDDNQKHANDPVTIFMGLLQKSLREHKFYVSDSAYREVREYHGETSQVVAHVPQPPQFLDQQDIVDDRKSSWGWNWNEHNRIYSPGNGSQELGVLKQDGAKILLCMYSRDFKEHILPLISKLGISQNTPLPGTNELLAKLKEAGKLTSTKPTHLHGRASRTGTCYVLDMTPAPETDAPAPAPETDGPAPAPETDAPAPAPETDGPAPEINELNKYDLACSLLFEMEQNQCSLRIAEDDNLVIGIPEVWTDNQYKALEQRVIALELPLRDILSDMTPAPAPDSQANTRHQHQAPASKRKSDNAYVDIVQGNGITVSGVAFTFPAHCSLPELVNIMQSICEIERVFVCGTLPENYEQWLLNPAMWQEYTTGDRGHYLDPKDSSGHVARFKHRSTSKKLEIRTMYAWLGDTEYTVEQARDAVLLLTQYLQGAFTPDTSVYATPSQTFQQIWTRQNRLDGKKFNLLPQNVRDIIHATSGQGRVELCTLPDIKKISGLNYYDGIFMYAGLIWGLGTELETHDYENSYAGYKPARYHIRYTVPGNWQHIGLFMTPNDDRESWYYPGDTCLGQTFETWVDGSELDVLRDHYGSIEAGIQAWNVTILERIIFKSEKDSSVKKPLDAIAKKLVNMREQIEKDAQLDTTRSHIYKLVRGMVRNILLHGIGAFHRNKRNITIILKNNEPAPDNVIDVKLLDDDRIIYTVPGKVDAYSEQFDHPEWSALVWARCRARMTKHALSLPRESVIAIRTDAIATTKEKPEWKSNTKVGTLREKWHIKRQLKAPHSYEELDTLVAKYIKEER